MTLILVLAEAALQRVPNELGSHPQIMNSAKRRGKSVNEILLDRSIHHSAMRRLAGPKRNISPEKMGRPDIVHQTLLQVLETPLNWENKLNVLIHTQDDYLINVSQKVRLPKNYVRFVGLIEQLFKHKQVPLEGEPLLTLERASIKQTVNRLNPTKIIGLSTLGKPKLMRSVADELSKCEKPMALIGAFPRGHFTTDTNRVLDEIYSIDRKGLDAWVVAGRFVYDFEWAIGIARTRIGE